MNNNKPKVPMLVPDISGGQQQPYNIKEAISRKCLKCGHELFDMAIRLGHISKMSPGNRSGQDILVKYESYVCRKCEWEYGTPIVDSINKH